MQSINTLSLSPDVNHWLANSHHARVLHVFDRACNLINERREVLSIVVQEIGDGPFNLVVEEDVVFSDHLSLESPISNSPNLLKVGELTIDTQNASLWSSRPDWEMLNARWDDISKLLFTNYQVRGLDTPFVKTTQGYSTTIFQPKLPITNYCEASLWDQSPVSSLPIALATADLPTTLNATQKLAGLGIGLTPSGDDFIMGAILAAWIIHPVDVAAVLAMEITEVAAPLTTSLSGAWLKSAGRGEAGILWHQFFDALISVGRIGNPTYAVAIQASMGKILSVGETSGADALEGFIDTMTCWRTRNF